MVGDGEIQRCFAPKLGITPSSLVTSSISHQPKNQFGVRAGGKSTPAVHIPSTLALYTRRPLERQGRVVGNQDGTAGPIAYCLPQLMGQNTNQSYLISLSACGEPSS
jgi:hypothetical protein